jgi:parvulin-like peptidyl-prolyl isomerase
MYKIGSISLLLSLILIACSENRGGTKLSPEEPAYQLAVELREKVSVLHPDSNKILVSTSQFDITTADVLRLIQQHLGNRLDQLINRPAEQIRTIVQQNATRYAEKKLLLLSAEEHNISISEKSIDSVMQKQYTQWGGKEQYQKSLENRNISYDVMVSDIRDGLMINRYFRQVVEPQIKVDKEKVEFIYNNYTATVRHILIMAQGKSDTEKQTIREKLEKILKRARNGEDFSELAKQYSEDPGSSKQGGIYKDFTRGKMVKPFEDASFSLDAGEISDIVETEYGYHIIQVVERNKHPQPYEKAIELITTDEKKQLKETFSTQHVQSLCENAGFSENKL